MIFPCVLSNCMTIFLIAGNTFRENVRDKVLYNLVLFALLLIICSLLLGQLSIGYEMKIIVDLGLTSISLVGVLIAVFIGIGLVYKEIDRRTIYNIVSKPVTRRQFLLGKFLGLLMTLGVNVAFMALGIFAALVYLSSGWYWGYLNILPAIVLIFMELVLVTAIALFFSSFTTPVLSAVFTLCIWLAGHFNGDLVDLARISQSSAMEYTCRVLYYLLPNFSNFKIATGRLVIQQAGYMEPPDAMAVLAAASYGFLYAVILVVVAAGIFERRDFK